MLVGKMPQTPVRRIGDEIRRRENSFCLRLTNELTAADGESFAKGDVLNGYDMDMVCQWLYK